MFASVLTLALLFVQSIGLLHTIVHPGNQAGAHIATLQATQPATLDTTPIDAQTASDGADDSGLFSLTHSCASFDAATLAAAVHVKAFEILFAIGAGLPPAAALPISHIPQLRCEFDSRAPPVRLS